MRNRAIAIVTVGLLACAPVRADDTTPATPPVVAMPAEAPVVSGQAPETPTPTPDAAAPVSATPAVAPTPETAPTPAVATTASVPVPAPAPPVTPTARPAAPVVAHTAPPVDEDAPPPLDDAAFDAAFQCPETLAGVEGRMAEIARYFAWTKLRHPDWNFRKRLDVRYGLLRRHACATTLASVAASARPPFRH